MTNAKFRRIVYSYYKKSGRHDLPWRTPALRLRTNGTLDPYKIMISEIMLQQTQVDRVIPKYKSFLKRFPTIHALADAPLASVLDEWSGLGYNRRARFLKLAAQAVIEKHQGKFPKEKSVMLHLPGIGEYTAGAIRAFAFDQPDVLLETNIRSVYIHCFFPGKKSVHDKELIPLVENTLDKKNPRMWYSALMDYGAYIKSQTTNPTRKSIGYKRQSTFIGSNRQIRGKMLKYMIKNGSFAAKDMSFIDPDFGKITEALRGLIKDGLVRKVGSSYRLER